MPVLMLTARGDETDQVVGLEVGADDCLTKGSSTRQFLERLHAVTRCAQAAGTPAAKGARRSQPRRSSWPKYASTWTLADRPVVLTPGEFDIP